MIKSLSTYINKNKNEMNKETPNKQERYKKITHQRCKERLGITKEDYQLKELEEILKEEINEI